jgi:uncharacterized protein YdhG (YjbR/CyaY superfamily)
MFNRF